MSKIEGIIPHQKHETIDDSRRGKFEPHEDIHMRSRGQRQLIGIIALVSVIVLVGGWILLAQNGKLFTRTSTDEQFVHSLTNTLSSNQSLTSTSVQDANTSQNVTPEEKKVLEQVDEELFPEFQ